MSVEQDEEARVLKKELQWLIEEEVITVLDDVYSTLLDCSQRFLLRISEDNLVSPQKILLTSTNGTGHIKCVATLLGDQLCEADISFKQKQGNNTQPLKTSIHPEVPWKLQQMQDAGNHLSSAIHTLHIDPGTTRPVPTSAQQVLLMVDSVMEELSRARRCLVLPKRKSIDDLLHNRNMHSFIPPPPPDIALSFYIHSHKLVLALYYISINNQGVAEISARHQVECSVPWLNEIIVLFTVALQQCQQLKDKICTLLSFDDVCDHHT